MQTYCLKDLPNLSLQDIFDIATEHLLFQFEKCAGSWGSCFYRHEGKKCAFGVFISDEEYTKAMEGKTAFIVIEKFGIPVGQDRGDLVNSLQVIHDDCLPNKWVERLHSLAICMGVISPIVEEIE